MKISIYPYTKKDALDYIHFIMASNPDNTFVYNIGSRCVLEKAGFQLEGIMKCNAVKNGKILDMALYGLTRQTV